MKSEEKINKEVEMVYEVLTRLTGKIKPVGETHEDNRRYDNLKVFLGVTNKLLVDIDEVEHENYERTEHSLKRAANLVGEFLDKAGIIER